jgi:UDP-N-acetyl-D-glucosamine dehydrogenase
MSPAVKFDLAIIGLGYVGLPLALQFAKSGCCVLGLDIDLAKTKEIEAGKSYIRHIPAADVAAQVKAGGFTASSDFSLVKQSEAIVICVPTPLNKNREPDISYILNTGEAIAAHLKPEGGGRKKLVVLESTTYPGTTDEVLRKVLEKGSGLKAGIDFHLAFPPSGRIQEIRKARWQKFPRWWGG